MPKEMKTILILNLNLISLCFSLVPNEFLFLSYFNLKCLIRKIFFLAERKMQET